MIDTHAHLYFDAFDSDRDETIARARAAGVEMLINVGIDVATSRRAVELAMAHEGLFATIGLHPTSQIDDLERDVAEIARLAREHPDVVVAIGEIGRDDHWKDVPAEAQRPRLLRQLELALDLGLPVVFHCRDALDDLLEILERASQRPPGVFHCFGGAAGEARRALDLDYHVSFAGNVTYPSARALREAAAVVPPERLLLETDSPYLAPQPCRGRRNEPAFVRHTRDFLAKLKGLSPEALAAITTANARSLFGLGAGSGG